MKPASKQEPPKEYIRTIRDAIDQEQTSGKKFDAVYGNDYLLTIDLDSPEQHVVYQTNLTILQQYIHAVEVGSWPSKSKKGTHKLVQLKKPQSQMDRFALQAFLGSDPKRELLGWLNVNDEEGERSVLFKPITEVF